MSNVIERRISQKECPLCSGDIVALENGQMIKETNDPKYGKVKVCKRHPIPEDKKNG